MSTLVMVLFVVIIGAIIIWYFASNGAYNGDR